MKILLISSSSGSHGGGEFYLHGLAKGLVGRGHQVHVVLNTHQRMDDLAEGFCQPVQVHRVAFRNTYDFRTRVLGCHFSRLPDRNLLPLLDRINPDVIHLNKQNLEDGLDLLRLLRKSGRPSVATIHVTRSAHQLGAVMGRLRDWYSRTQLARFRGAFVAVALQCCNDLRRFLSIDPAGDSAQLPCDVAATNATQGKLQAGFAGNRDHSGWAATSPVGDGCGRVFKEGPRRCVVVHNGVPESDQSGGEMRHFSPRHRLYRILAHSSSVNEVASTTDGSPITEGVMRNDCKLILGTVARIEQQKNPLMAVRLLQKLPNSIHWVWVGDGRMCGRMEEAARSVGVAHRLHLLGWQSDARQFMPAFDVFVLPSLYEGFPFAILEAMAERLPCVVSDVDGCREAVVDGRTGFLCPVSDIDIWVQRLGQVHQDHQQRNLMAQLGFDRWKRHFSLEAMAKETEAVYLREIARVTPPSARS